MAKRLRLSGDGEPCFSGNAFVYGVSLYFCNGYGHGLWLCVDVRTLFEFEVPKVGLDVWTILVVTTGSSLFFLRLCPQIHLLCLPYNILAIIACSESRPWMRLNSEWLFRGFFGVWGDRKYL